MIIASKFRNARVFGLKTDIKLPLVQEFDGQYDRAILKDPPASAQVSSGLVPDDDGSIITQLLDTGIWVFRFGVSTRIIPRSAFRAKCAEIRAEVERKGGEIKDGEVRDRAYAALLPQALIETKYTTGHFDLDAKLLVIHSTGKAISDRITRALREVFGSLGLVPFGNNGELSFADRANEIIDGQTGGAPIFFTSEELKYRWADEERVTVRDMRDIEGFLEAHPGGVDVEAISINVENGLDVQATLGKDFVIRKLALGDIASDAITEAINGLQEKGSVEEGQEHDVAGFLITARTLAGFVREVGDYFNPDWRGDE